MSHLGSYRAVYPAIEALKVHCSKSIFSVMMNNFLILCQVCEAM